MTATTRAEAATHLVAERDALVADLDQLSDEEWATPSLCAGWTVADVVAHLGAALTTGQTAWILSMLRARLRPEVHNQRRLAQFRGPTARATLTRLARLGTPDGEALRTPTKDPVPWLGELIVHGEDIRRPLGLARDHSTAGLEVVAAFFASRDYAVNSKTQVRGLRLRASDASFTAGTADLPLVEGPLLSLIMVMAGRAAFLDSLTGDGVAVLRAVPRRPERPRCARCSEVTGSANRPASVCPRGQ